MSVCSGLFKLLGILSEASTARISAKGIFAYLVLDIGAIRSDRFSVVQLIGADSTTERGFESAWLFLFLSSLLSSDFHGCSRDEMKRNRCRLYKGSQMRNHSDSFAPCKSVRPPPASILG